MAINIKNPKTVEAVKAAAAALDLSYTTVIDIACEQLLAHRHGIVDERDVGNVLKIAAAYRANLPQRHHVLEADLYDEQGLYR